MTADGEAIVPEKVDIQLKDLKEENPYKPCEREPSLKGNGDVVDSKDDDQPVQLQVYARRWLVLAVVALLNNTNTISWIAFAPVSNHVNIFYGEGKAGWFSLIYMACTIPVGFFAMWASRKFGLRTSILIAGWTNGIGGLIRLISSFLPFEYRFPVGITGQAIAAIAYPFIMFLPTKVAGSWFPDTQRALATTIGVMSNPLGVLMANVISPAMVKSADHVPWLNAFTFVPSLLAMLLATFGVNRSHPKIPPTYSASQQQMDFVPGLVACMKSVQYLVLLLVMGGGIGMFNCLYTVLSELLCASGYSNQFAGICAALMIIGGVVGATLSGIFVDRTQRYVETMKVAMALAVVFGLAFLQLTLRPSLHAFIVPTCLLFGVLGLATYPVGLQLSAECTYPVSEETSTGLIVLSGQIQSVIYVMVMKTFYRDLEEERENVQVCRVGKDDTSNIPHDSTVSVMIFSVIAFVLVLILVIFFRPVYKRMEAERENRAKQDKEKELAEKNDRVTLPNQNNVTQPLNA